MGYFKFDKQYFTALYNEHHEVLLKITHKKIGNYEYAKDIVQLAFENLWKIRADFQNENAVIRRLYQITIELATRYLNGQKKNSELKEKLIQEYLRDENLIQDEELKTELLNKIYLKVESFPQRRKEIFQLHYYKKMPSTKIADKLGLAVTTVDKHIQAANANLRELFSNTIKKSKVPNDSLGNIKKRIAEVSVKLLYRLAKHPSRIRQLGAYQFEVVIAELLRDMGHDVYLTPKTKDGGIDILAVMRFKPDLKILTIVECKKNAPKRKIGIDIVKQFLYTLTDGARANKAIIVTTSSFSKDVGEMLSEKKLKWSISLTDFDAIKGWLSKYGQLKTRKGKKGIWLPFNPLS